MTDHDSLHAALTHFAEAVTAKMTQVTAGEPEEQLRAPFEAFIEAAGRALGHKIVCTGETMLPGRVGKPDYAVHSRGTLTGFAELKAPGSGADPRRFSGHNREQWKRFQSIPNLLYSDGNDWGLFRSGEVVGRFVRLSGDMARDGKKAATVKDAMAVIKLLTDFFSWQPIVPKDAKELASLLAPLCRMLRADVTDALKDPASPLVQLAKDWRQLLFPDATDEKFADAYAQTVTFALLLARSEGAHPLTLASAESGLAAEHSLLSRALQVLTDPAAQAEISASLNLLLRIVGEVPPEALAGPSDPWLYFYEDFLAAYDPELRRDTGAYYTPVQIARVQIRLVDDLLTRCLGKKLGFAADHVVTLDPAAGTGTYLLSLVDHALRRIEAEQGAGAVPGMATALANNLFGFEIMVGPFAVTELRVTRALQNNGAKLPRGGTHVYLTDTLESPHTTPPQLPLYLSPIAEQHRRALEVKEKKTVIVCLGNPPYDRHEAADETNRAGTGGWVRWGDEGDGSGAIFRTFLDSALDAGQGVHVKNLYNLYVYFWRWALWKVFEQKVSSESGPGIVSFISASSYLDGAAFRGMREHMRRLCDEIWIIDLGGEGRGTRRNENVFAIQTPVAIAIAVRYGETSNDAPAKVRYVRLDGSREEKLTALNAVDNFASLKWTECNDQWHAPFRPSGAGKYFRWPLLADLMPWQHSGAECKRTWPICHDRGTLESRWRALLAASDKAAAFRETRDRKVNGSYPPLWNGGDREPPLVRLPRDAAAPTLERYAYRSFDRQWILADTRLCDYLRPNLWRIRSEKQIYFASQIVLELGEGPALMASAEVPDLHYFAGRGGKDTIPLYRDALAQEANILPGLLDKLAKKYARPVSPEDFAAYVYGILAQPAFTERFSEELTLRQLRVPLTKDVDLFARVRTVGEKLLWLHTFGCRFVPRNRHAGQLPKGEARCTKAVPSEPDEYPDAFEYDETTQTLHVGQGRFRPVGPDAYRFNVSGLMVVQSWLRYRMKAGAGRKSSTLDDIRPNRWTSEFTTELLELLWLLEGTVGQYPTQSELLSAVLKGPLFRADELPTVPDASRKPPSRESGNTLFDTKD